MMLLRQGILKIAKEKELIRTALNFTYPSFETFKSEFKSCSTKGDGAQRLHAISICSDGAKKEAIDVSRRYLARVSSEISKAGIAKERYEKLKKAKEKEGKIEKVQESQPITSEPSEIQIATAVNHPALIVTRDIEWGTVILGFEQATKYTVLDQDGKTVALIAEDITGIGNVIGRQLLRTRRSFTSTVFSADGSQIIFRIRRPMYLINSSMYVEDGEGSVLGEIQQRWHLLKRNYDLYIDKRQFAKITGNFLAWEFELKDENGGTLALIDRNFQGFAKEIFTDAGKYVIHFGDNPEDAAKQVTETLRVRTKNPSLPAVTPMAQLRTGVAVIPQFTGNQLVVSKRMSLSERMITLACAMTIDYDYFSNHSTSSGWLTPPLILPMPGSGEGSGAAAENENPAVQEVNPATGGESGKDEWLDSGEGEHEDSYAGNEMEDEYENDDDGEGGGFGSLLGGLKDILGDGE